MAWLRIFNPEVFQGNLERRKYFEGWYLKHVSADLTQVLSFIPGVSLQDREAFIQVINGISGESWFYTFPLEEFRWNDQEFSISIGENVFTNKYSRLNLKSKQASFQGELHYSDMVKYPRDWFNPGIMGPYSFMPFMECSHAIVSATHHVQGSIKTGKEKLDFNGGKGYMEKDWGRSFPQAWIWLQCNNFSQNNTSLMFSLARVPYLGQIFNGLAAFLYHEGKFHIFTTWNKAELVQAEMLKNTLTVELKQGNKQLRIEAVRSRVGELKAPQNGEMSRVIKESVDSRVSIEFNDGAGLTYKDKGQRAGLEIIDEIFQYLKPRSTIKTENSSQVQTET